MQRLCFLFESTERTSSQQKLYRTPHTMISRLPPLTRVCPSGLIATHLIKSECPARVLIKSPECRFQTLMVLSLLQLTIVCPSRLMATHLTPPECPARVLIKSPVCRFQTLMVLSLLPLTIVCP